MMTSPPTNEPNLQELSDFQQWCAHSPRVSLLAYAEGYLTSDLAIAVTRLFWPAFLVHRDGVFLADFFCASSFDDWYQKLGALSSVEQMMNHRHLHDLLPRADMGRDNAVYVGQALKGCWQAALAAAFPTRHFTVEGEWSDADEDFVLTFWQTDSDAPSH